MSTPSKVAIVTGASQGIGAGLVAAYRAAGYGVVATSRSITDSGDADVVAVPGDIADPATAARVVEVALERFGRIDTLINNAGVFVAKPFTEYTVEDFELLSATNLAGFFHLTQRAAAVMLEAGSGHIATITTSLVEQPDEAVPSGLASLTKGGLQAATKSLAIEFAARGVRVNAVAPGYIKTAIHPENTHSTLAGMHPMDRMGEISDIVSAIMYLEGAEFITGEVLHADGGMSVGRTAA